MEGDEAGEQSLLKELQLLHGIGTVGCVDVVQIGVVATTDLEVELVRGVGLSGQCILLCDVLCEQLHSIRN